MLNKTQKLILGIIILIFVDVIWVSSSELTKFLYKDEHFDKPFFCTYFKTSMFTVYLIVMGLITPWKEQCDKQNTDYSMMDQSADDENYYLNHGALASPATLFIIASKDAGVEYISFGQAEANALVYLLILCLLGLSLYQFLNFYIYITSCVEIMSQSDPTFIPIRTNGSGTHGVVSGTESDDSSVRSVRFSKLAEVREMSVHEATDALMSRLSYTASIRIRRQKTHHQTAKIALLFCVLWFFANYLFQLSLDFNETAKLTLLSSSSSFFTLVLAALFPSSSGDKITITKVLAVALNIAGVVNITLGDVQNRKFSRGVLWALFSAFFYSAYLVFIKRRSDNEEKIDIPLFFGFVGLWNMLLMWPIFLILNCLQIEKFELPNQNQFTILVLNGLVGTVLSEALWLWGCFLTSSLMGTIAMSLQIPLSIIFDVLLKKKRYSPMFYMGSISIFISLLLVALLARYDDSDPLMKLFKIIYRKICSAKRPSIVRVSDDEQQESLISGSD